MRYHPSNASRHSVARLVPALVIAIALGTGPPARADEPREEASARSELDRAFAQRLEFLAKKCQELELPDQAQATREWLVPRDPGRQYFFLPDDTVAKPPGESQLVRQWWDKFLSYRQWYAAQLFDLAKQRAEAGDESTAYQLLHELLSQDPAHADARRVLGHRRTSAGWQVPGRQPTVRQTRVAHPDFGWAARRYWRIESEHFLVTTNHSPQAGVELAQQLERLHAVWQQAFFRYWAEPGTLAARLAGQDRSLGPSPPRNVVLFADRDEYNRQLSRAEPQIAVTVGYYSADHRRAYFFASEQPDVATWYHEATHQLFHESPNVASQVGEKSNFWILEGIALYMESLRYHDGYATLGGFDANRLQFARFRALNERFHLPLNELVKLGRADLQRHEELGRLYSQSAGLAHFLMDGQAGRYRQATIDYLAALYRGVADEQTLARAAGTSLDELDRHYPRFLNVTDADFRHLRWIGELRNLSLGHTEVTDAAMEALGKAERLQWLDLAHTQVTDAGVAKLAGLTELTQLNVEGTRITDSVLKDIGRLSKLEELDLSNTAITDEGLSHIRTLRQLKTLWLTNTAISDAGLMHLAELPALESIDLRDTRVTEQGRRQLKQRRPNLDAD